MLRQKLQDDQIKALKSGDKVSLTVIRFVISQVKNREIEKKSELNDEEILVVLKKFAKELKESIDAFTKGNRQELVEENKKQLEVANDFNIGNGIIHVKHHEDKTEIFSFASKPEYKHVLDFYMNNLNSFFCT